MKILHPLESDAQKRLENLFSVYRFALFVAWKAPLLLPGLHRTWTQVKLKRFSK